MQNPPVKTVVDMGVLAGSGFSHVSRNLAYVDMAGIRGEISEFLGSYRVDSEHTGHALLVVTEVLSNLVKHPSRRADHVEVRLRVSGLQIIIEVLDNSTSFANFDAKCKEALKVLHAGVTAAESGFGLGLIVSLCNEVAYTPQDQAAGGLNRFRAMFTLRPVVPDAVPRKKIFLVDDDPFSLQVHEAMIEDAYEVIAFSKAEDALAAFAQGRPDLIISDLMMPGMNGIDLRKALDGVEGGDTTPFIFLSGKSASEHNNYISQLGVDDFLCKPVSKTRLRTVLGRLLHRSRQLRDAVESQFHQDITDILKPAVPDEAGRWRFGLCHASAEAGGGDFVLYHQSPAMLDVAIIDVMGHGRQAKFFSYVYAGYLRSLYRLRTVTNAAEFLTQVSRSVGSDPLLDAMFMTCQCFRFEETGAVRIVSAGHPAPLLLRKSGAAEVLDVMGPLPGLVGDSVYELKTFTLAPGDKIISMTDGFLDVFDDGNGLATQALLQRVQAAPPMPAAALAAHLWGLFLSQQDQRAGHKDDATIIVAEYGEKK